MSHQHEREEVFRINGDQMVSKVKELLREGNVRRIIIKNKDGRVLLEMPVTVGLIGAVLMPPLAAVGAMAALLTECTIVVVRDEFIPKSDLEQTESIHNEQTEETPV